MDKDNNFKTVLELIRLGSNVKISCFNFSAEELNILAKEAADSKAFLALSDCEIYSVDMLQDLAKLSESHTQFVFS